MKKKGSYSTIWPMIFLSNFCHICQNILNNVIRHYVNITLTIVLVTFYLYCLLVFSHILCYHLSCIWLINRTNKYYFNFHSVTKCSKTIFINIHEQWSENASIMINAFEILKSISVTFHLPLKFWTLLHLQYTQTT